MTLTEADALTDVLLVAGGPVASTRLLANPENSCKVVMKDGRSFNALEWSATNRVEKRPCTTFRSIDKR